MRSGKLAECDRIELRNGEVIKKVQRTGYKYLGVLELDNDVKEKFCNE